MEPSGHKLLVVNVVVAGSIRRGRGGDWYNSDVVKVKGEDPDRLSKGGQGEVGTSAISDCECVSLGSLTMKSRDRT